MSLAGNAARRFIGWDVGGWNCDHNRTSRDAIVILGPGPVMVGKPWRGNLRSSINQAAEAAQFIQRLFELCHTPAGESPASITLAIDTPLGFSDEFARLVTGLKPAGPVGRSQSNPYLYRQTERFLFERGLRPLSPVKDMIGSQATKGMHVLAKFAPQVQRCGVWSDGRLLTAIEAYPSACKRSAIIQALREQVGGLPKCSQDEMDALTCALIAYLFTTDPDRLLAPGESVPTSEGWIWAPKDILG